MMIFIWANKYFIWINEFKINILFNVIQAGPRSLVDKRVDS